MGTDDRRFREAGLETFGTADRTVGTTLFHDVRSLELKRSNDRIEKTVRESHLGDVTLEGFWVPPSLPARLPIVLRQIKRPKPQPPVNRLVHCPGVRTPWMGSEMTV